MGTQYHIQLTKLKLQNSSQTLPLKQKRDKNTESSIQLKMTLKAVYNGFLVNQPNVNFNVRSVHNQLTHL